jgi:hypothetical protein
MKFQDNKKRSRPTIPVEGEEREDDQIPYEQPASEVQMDCEMSASLQDSERDFMKMKRRNILTNNSHSPPHQASD